MSITFREFVELVEGKKKKNKKLSPSMPPNGVPGTYYSTPEYTQYTLAPYTGPSKPFNKPKEVIKQLNKQGGTGGKAIKKVIKQREEQQEGFSYGSESYQQELEKKRKETEERRKEEAKQRREALYHERTRGRGIRVVHSGKSGWIKDGVFTPDT